MLPSLAGLNESAGTKLTSESGSGILIALTASSIGVNVLLCISFKVNIILSRYGTILVFTALNNGINDVSFIKVKLVNNLSK